MIFTVTLNTSVDHALFLEELRLGDTNRVTRTETDAGGKGVNLARVAAEMGASAVATGFAGGGPGAFIRHVLETQGVQHEFVETAGETRTNFSVEDATGAPPTTFNARGPQIAPGELEALWLKCRTLASGARWVAMGGSIPPGVPEDIYRGLTTVFREESCRVVVDSDGEPMRMALEARPCLCKPNAREASRLLGWPVVSVEDAIPAAREIREMQGGGDAMTIVSMGADGAVLASAEGVLVGISPKVETRSSIGSGDSLLGAFLWALEDGRPLEEAFRWGLAAGAATATTNGAEIARRPAVEALFPQAIVRGA